MAGRGPPFDKLDRATRGRLAACLFDCCGPDRAHFAERWGVCSAGQRL